MEGRWESSMGLAEVEVISAERACRISTESARNSQEVQLASMSGREAELSSGNEYVWSFPLPTSGQDFGNKE
jgi:hypothetical protein